MNTPKKSYSTIYFHTCFICLLFITVGLFAQADSNAAAKKQPSPKVEEEDLNVFDHWLKWNNPGSVSINHMIKQVDKLYDLRDKKIAALKTKSDWQARQKYVRRTLDQIIGTFPEKQPLNPEITGVVQKEGYRIEKIIFQPVPGYYESGCLYIPDNLKGKAPAILNVIGHDQASYKEQYYQVIITNLLKKGMIVFVIEPLGQGEHVQYYDTTLKFSAIGYSVVEHSYFGNICFLTGTPSAKYFILDGMRAIDYLLTRKEVDPENIGVTGFSGGGTVTAYLAAFDERVKVAIPCSWPTAYQRLLETKGAQDAETILIGGLPKGITFEDLLEVRAPKPVLMSFTSRDEYLSLQGAREALKEGKKAYTAYGKPGNIQLVQDDSKHAMTPKIRLAMYAFFQKHFNLQGDSTEEKTDLPSAKELVVSPTGQIATYKGGKMVFDLNKEYAASLIERLEQSRKNVDNHIGFVKSRAKEISGYRPPSNAPVEPFINGRYHRDGYTVELDAIAGESDEYAIPLLLFEPDDNTTKHPAVIYLHSKGKITDAAPGGEIEKLVKMGYVVAAADVLGCGETLNTAASEYAEANTAVYIGRSMVAIQAADVLRVANFLKTLKNVDRQKIGAVAYNEMCIPLIHAAAFDSSINNISLVGSLISYRSVVNNKFYKIGITPIPGHDYWHPVQVDFKWGVASALTAYDLPDLVGAIAPRRVALVNLKDQMLKPASSTLVEQEMTFPKSAYLFKHSPGNLRVEDHMDNLASIVRWSFE
jgi:dienelactone hydrolase